MKLHLLALAAGLVIASGANALTPADIAAARTAGTIKEISISGASALRLSLAAYAAEICDNASLHVYFNGTLPVVSSSGANHRAYACNLSTTVGNYAAGTPVVLYKRDQGGSTWGVNPIAQNGLVTHMKIANDGSCAVTPNPTFSDIQIPNYLCSGTEDRVSDAGISDVEPDMLNQIPNLPDKVAGDPASGVSQAADFTNVNVTPFVQGIFGVAVNKQAYLALQKTQGLVAASATTIDESDAARPSLPTTFVRAMLTGGLSGGSTNSNNRGWGLVIDQSVDSAVATKAFNICRRQPGSGTQAASNIYFAQNPCGGSAAVSPLRQASKVVPTHAAVGSYIVDEQSGTGGVETCLGTTVNGITGAYGLGVLGRENNPLANGGDKGYRYVRLDGMNPVRYDAATGKGATTGHYDFVFESTIQYNNALDADKAAFIGAVTVGAPKPSSLAAADADTQQGVMSPVAAWSSLGQYPVLTATAKPFASRVARSTGASCTVLKYVR